MKFSKMRQRLGYGFADMASNLIWVMLVLYLNSYYTQGLSIGVLAFNIITLGSKVIDAFTDILMGIVVDKTNMKSGKARPYLMIGAIPLGLTAVLTFLLPTIVKNESILMLTFAFLTYNLISTAYTIVNTPLSALLPSLSSDPKERNILVTYRMVMAAIGSACVQIFAPLLLKQFDSDHNTYSYFWVMLIFAIPAVILLFVSFANTREIVKPANQEKMHVKDGFRAINGQYILLVVTMFIYLIGFAIKQAGVVYYYQWYVGDIGDMPYSALQSIQGIVTSIFMPVGQLTIPFFCSIMGKKNSCIVMNIAALVANVLFLFSGTNVPLILISTAILWFALGYLMGMRFSLLADVIEYTELKTGIRAAGFLSCFDSFLAKLTFAFNGMIMVGLMNAGGYNPALSVQSDTTKFFIQIGFTVVPIICIIITIILFMIFKFDKELPELKKQHEAKQAATA